MPMLADYLYKIYMHNLHFIVLNAPTGEEACERAESFISDYGNENNWREICGAVSENNVVYSSGEGRFQPEENMTIDECNKWLNVWRADEGYGNSAADKLRAGQTDIYTWDTYELWSLKHLAEYLCQIHNITELNVLHDNFYHYQYDHEGVTQMDDYTHEGSERWVVFVDMHS